MLPAFLSSWFQGLSGAGASASLLEAINGSLIPLLFTIPLAILALLFIDRNGSKQCSATASPFGPISGAAERRSAVGSIPPGPTPLVAAPTPVEPAPGSDAALVLVADDSALVRARLSRLLVAEGFRVVCVNDGQQALEAIQDGQLPAVLITDLEMPAVDGFELIAAVHGAIETEHVPIIAITGHDDLQARVGDLSGIYGIFKKPWNDRELIRRVQALAAVAEIGRTAR